MRILALEFQLALLLSFVYAVQAFAADHTVASASYASGAPFLQAGVSYRESIPDRNLLQIDNRLRQIGGTGKSSVGRPPLQKFVFQGTVPSQSGYANLIIGSIKGINTPEAHQMGLSNVGFVSSPTVIKVNGQPVGYIYSEAENVTVQVPNRVLRQNGFNTVQIEAGFYFLAHDYIAYDAVEFQNLALEY